MLRVASICSLLAFASANVDETTLLQRPAGLAPVYPLQKHRHDGARPKGMMPIYPGKPAQKQSMARLMQQHKLKDQVFWKNYMRENPVNAAGAMVTANQAMFLAKSVTPEDVEKYNRFKGFVKSIQKFYDPKSHRPISKAPNVPARGQIPGKPWEQFLTEDNIGKMNYMNSKWFDGQMKLWSQSSPEEARAYKAWVDETYYNASEACRGQSALFARHLPRGDELYKAEKMCLYLYTSTMATAPPTTPSFIAEASQRLSLPEEAREQFEQNQAQQQSFMSTGVQEQFPGLPKKKNLQTRWASGEFAPDKNQWIFALMPHM